MVVQMTDVRECIRIDTKRKGELMDDLISRRAAIDALRDAENHTLQPDGIPLEWIDKHLEWLDNCDNDFAQLAKVSIKAMVELWKKDRI